MNDRETIITRLHETRKYLEDKEWSDRMASPHIDNINDAIELLKEQSEADEVAPTIGEGVEGEEVICCGSCGTALYYLFPWIKINKAREFVQYCRHCGREVKWE